MNLFKMAKKRALKDKLEKLAKNELLFSADELLEIAADAVILIENLEDECLSRYNEGKIDGMERMAEILRGEVE